MDAVIKNDYDYSKAEAALYLLRIILKQFIQGNLDLLLSILVKISL